MPEATRPKLSAGPVLVILGGILVLISGFTDWAKVTGDVPYVVTVKGSGFVLIVGVILAVVGLGLWLAKTRGAHIALGIVAVVAGLVAVLIAGVAIGSKDTFLKTAADDYAKHPQVSGGLSADRIEKILKEEADAGKIDTSVKIGLWFGLAGGVLVLVGGISGIAKAPKKEAAAGAPPGMPFEAPAGAPPPPPSPGAPPPSPPAPRPGPGEPGSGPSTP